MIGVAIVMALIYGSSWYFSTHAGAAVMGQAAIKATAVINPLNTVWVLVTAFLVFFMQAGFMMLEGLDDLVAALDEIARPARARCRHSRR